MAKEATHHARILELMSEVDIDSIPVPIYIAALDSTILLSNDPLSSPLIYRSLEVSAGRGRSDRA